MRCRVAFVCWLLLVAAALAAPLVKKPQVKKPQPVRWIDNWHDGWLLSRKTKRPILVMFATPWSPWCQAMDAQVWTRPHLRMLASRYVMVRLDAEKDVLMANRFKVVGYPTILLTWEGYMLGRDVGNVPPRELVAMLQKGLRMQAVLQKKLR